jgi:uroporphyrinogen decarboxylase
MTKRERVINTIAGRPCDVLPHHSDLTYASMLKLSAYYGVPLADVEDRIGNHLQYINYEPPGDGSMDDQASKTDSGTFSAGGQSDTSGHVIDEWGVTWDNKGHQEIGDWGLIDHPVRNFDFSRYTWPDGCAGGRFRHAAAEAARRPDAFHTLLMTGLFDSAWHVTGLEDCLAAMADPDSANIDYLLDRTLAFLVGVVEQVPDGLFDGVRFLEDWGIQKGLLTGAERWRRHLKPRLRELYQTAKNKGLYVHSHSCGDNLELFPDMIELGVDISDPVQPESMDIRTVKERFGSSLTLMGGLPCQSILPLGTPAEVSRITRRTLEIMGQGGHYILGGAGSFPTETPPANIDAIVEVYRAECLKAGVALFG